MKNEPQTLQEAMLAFSDEQACIDALASLRWPDGPRCPDCSREHGSNPYYIKTQKRWKCRWCRRQFSVKVESVFEDSAIPLTKWLPALWMLVSSKNGVSSHEIHRALGVTQKSAWFMLHRLRTALKAGTFGTKLGGKSNDSGPVEVDETFIGGKLRNMHHDKKVRYEKRGGTHGKAIVMGLLDRELRQVRAKVVPNVKRETLQNEVLREVKYGSRVYTDEAIGYDNLHYRFVHDVVNHMETYVNGKVHTNGIENFWSLFKRTLSGTYVAVEPFHLERYIDEQVFRFNNRATKDNPLTDADRFIAALAQVAGKRLTYKELTGKNGPRATVEPF
jgi:transposase-like protein